LASITLEIKAENNQKIHICGRFNGNNCKKHLLKLIKHSFLSLWS